MEKVEDLEKRRRVSMARVNAIHKLELEVNEERTNLHADIIIAGARDPTVAEAWLLRAKLRS